MTQTVKNLKSAAKWMTYFLVCFALTLSGFLIIGGLLLELLAYLA